MNGAASRTRSRMVAAWAGIIAPALFVVVFTIKGFLSPGYNQLSMYISAGSLGPTGWIQMTNFVVVGLLLSVFNFGIRSEFRDGKASKAGPLLLFAISICLFFSGPFVMDPMGTATADASLHGTVHGLLGAIVFTLMPITCFVFYRRFRTDPQWRSMKWWTLICAIIITCTDVFYSVVSKVPAMAQSFADWLGLLQRSVLIPYMIWLFTFAMGFYKRRLTQG
jgi:hypothetical protein